MLVKSGSTQAQEDQKYHFQLLVQLFFLTFPAVGIAERSQMLAQYFEGSECALSVWERWYYHMQISWGNTGFHPFFHLFLMEVQWLICAGKAAAIPKLQTNETIGISFSRVIVNMSSLSFFHFCFHKENIKVYLKDEKKGKTFAQILIPLNFQENQSFIRTCVFLFYSY